MFGASWRGQDIYHTYIHVYGAWDLVMYLGFQKEATWLEP